MMSYFPITLSTCSLKTLTVLIVDEGPRDGLHEDSDSELSDDLDFVRGEAHLNIKPCIKPRIKSLTQSETVRINYTMQMTVDCVTLKHGHLRCILALTVYC